jgi:uncharacterized damage-inducible protein DinB
VRAAEDAGITNPITFIYPRLAPQIGTGRVCFGPLFRMAGMSTPDAGVSFRELLGYTDYLAQRWLTFFGEHPEALQAPAGGDTPTVGDLVDHVFLVEEVFSGFLHDGTAPPEQGTPGEIKVETFRRRHQEAYGKFIGYIDAASGADMRAKKKFSRFEASPRKLLSQSILHSVHHWAQIAMLVRRAGFDTGRPQDLILTDLME